MNFYQRCYRIIRKIPKGKVTTYKALAHMLGSLAYRAVGTAMKKNKHAPFVPCHRVVKSDGRVGNYSCSGGSKKKIALLRREGVIILHDRIDMKKYGWNF